MQRILEQEKIDSGSNYNFPDKMEIPRISRSVFNLSNTVSGTLANAGIIMPIEWWEYIPQDSFEISVQHIIRVLPQVVPLFSRQRIFIHAFAMNYGDMQNDFQTLMTKGYSGNVIKRIAPLTSSNLDSEIYDSGNGVVEPDSLADYLGLPQGASYSDLIESGISCLPFFMYEAIYKWYYMNRNYYIDNRNWLPDDLDSFRVDSNGVLLSNTDAEHPQVTFGKLHYRDYPDDYFTSALPFAQRGDRPTLPISFDSGDLFRFTRENLPYVTSLMTTNTTTPEAFYTNHSQAVYNAKTIASEFNSNISNGGFNQPLFVGSLHVASDPIHSQGDVLEAAAISANEVFNRAVQGIIQTNIGADDLRELIRQQVELEKMARTDGSYREFGLSFFSQVPATSTEHKPIFIGSTYDQISFTEVVQTSQSSVSSALGQIAGHGISVSNNGYIGRFTASDYGMIMIIATIMPDVYYSQGLDKKWTRKFQSEFYLPERAKMGLQPILNQELYYQGMKEQDEDLFGYQNPFDDLRYRSNRICGKIADMSNLSFSPYTQSRKFASLPTLSQSFAIADDVRKDYLYAPSEDAYAWQFSVNVRAVRPIPYKPIPNNFGF